MNLCLVYNRTKKRDSLLDSMSGHLDRTRNEISLYESMSSTLSKSKKRDSLFDTMSGHLDRKRNKVSWYKSSSSATDKMKKPALNGRVNV